MIIANRGIEDDKTIKVYKINLALLQKNIFRIMEKIDFLKQSKGWEEAKPYYYGELPDILGGVDISAKFARYLAKRQTVGNCQAASAKLSVRAALAAFAYFDKSSQDVAHYESKLASLLLRQRYEDEIV